VQRIASTNTRSPPALAHSFQDTGYSASVLATDFSASVIARRLKRTVYTNYQSPPGYNALYLATTAYSPPAEPKVIATADYSLPVIA